MEEGSEGTVAGTPDPSTASGLSEYLTPTSDSSPQTSRPERPKLQSLAVELLEEVFLRIDSSEDVSSLARTCRRLFALSSGTNLRARWLISRFGPHRVWYSALKHHRRLMAGEPGRWEDPGLPRDSSNDHPPSVPHALLRLGLKPPRHVIQQYFAWFSKPRHIREDPADEDGGAEHVEAPAGNGIAPANGVHEHATDSGSEGSWSTVDSGEHDVSSADDDDDDDEDPDLEDFDDDGGSSDADEDEDDSEIDDEDIDPDHDDMNFGADNVDANGNAADIMAAWREICRVARASGLTRSAALSRPIPPQLSFLVSDPLNPPTLKSPGPKVHDQILLLHLLSVASQAYGAAKLALNSDDALVFSNLVDFERGFMDAGDQIDAILENDDTGAIWLQVQRESFEKRKQPAEKLVEVFGFAPFPPMFPRKHKKDELPDVINEVPMFAIPSLAALAVKSPSLLQRLLKSGNISIQLVAPYIVDYLVFGSPPTVFRSLLADPLLQECGITLDKDVLFGMWDIPEKLLQLMHVDGEVVSPLIELVRGLTFPVGEDRLETDGPAAIRQWAFEKLGEIKDSILPPIFSQSEEAKKRLVSAIVENPALPLLIGREFGKMAAKELAETTQRGFKISRLLKEHWPGHEHLDVLAQLFTEGLPDAEERDEEELVHGKPAYLSVLLPKLKDPNVARVSNMLSCAARMYFRLEDGLLADFDEANRAFKNKQSLLVNAGLVYTLLSIPAGKQTPEEARGTYATPHYIQSLDLTGLICELVRNAAEELLPLAEACGQAEAFDQRQFEPGLLRLGALLSVAKDVLKVLDASTQGLETLSYHDSSWPRAAGPAKLWVIQTLDRITKETAAGIVKERNEMRERRYPGYEPPAEAALGELHTLFEAGASDQAGPAEPAAEDEWAESKAVNDARRNYYAYDGTFSIVKDVKWGEDKELRRVCWFANESSGIQGEFIAVERGIDFR